MTAQTLPTFIPTPRAIDRQPLGLELSSLGLHAQAGARVHAQLDALLHDGSEVGLAYAVVGGTGTVFEYAGGVADVATDTPVSSRTLFASASNTKVLTAAAVIQLATRGLLRLDDPLARYVPNQPYSRHVTLRQLLNHSSGVPNPMPLDWVHTQSEHIGYEESATLHAELRKHPKLRFEPGERYLYSNLGYWLLGRVIEEVAQTDYVSYLRSHILQPLGITEQQLSFDMTNAAELARGHLNRRSMLGWFVPWLVPSRFVASRRGRWLRFEHVYMNGAAYGGAFATTAGYARVLQDWLQPSPMLLGEAGKRWFFEPQQATSGRALPTTLGWHLGSLDKEPYFSKPGGGPGFSSNLRIYPSRQLATVLLSNRMRASEADIQRFADSVDRALLRDG